MYLPKVAAGVAPQSFTLGTIGFPTQSPELILHWLAPPQPGFLTLRVRSAKHPFQMQVSCPANDAQYKWTKPIELAANEPLVVLAKTNGYYVPAYSELGSRADYTAVFYSTDLLTRITIKVIDAQSATPTKTYWRKGPFDASEQFIRAEFPKSALPTQGAFTVGLIGLSASGTTVSAALNFLHQ